MPDLAVVRQVIGLVDSDGAGVTRHTAQLEHKGYTVVVCRWGSKVVEMATREQLDLLILDIVDRPDWMLAHVLRRLRNDPCTCNIPLLVNPPQDRGLYATIAGMIGAPPPGEPIPPPRWRRV